MNLIASADIEWGIGFQGDLLYHVSEDMVWFKKQTINKVVIMGRETYASLPGNKPLVDRVNIILSSKKDFVALGCIVCTNMLDLFAKIAKYDPDDLFVIGGASIYEQFLPYCHKAYITKFHKKSPADRYLPNIDQLDNWQLLDISKDFRHNDLRYNFCIYQNNSPKPLP
jgi:dihydrofolate reductase